MINTEGKTIVEVCTEIIETLIEQGRQCKVSSSVTGGEDCVYGDDHGNHCAIGWLLPDANHGLMSVRGDVEELIFDGIYLGQNDEFIRNNLGVMINLQTLHDDFMGSYYFADLGIPQTLIAQWMDLNPA